MAARRTNKSRRKLNQLTATAICGNDITSSCLYVSALAIIAAGKWAPLCLLMVAAVLFLFRSIYAEVVGALPLNGGAYNALLNTTSKFRASLAACLTILSYMATAVISASEAIHYLHNLWASLPPLATTAGLLGLFMVLTILGITESAAVAVGIFLLHLATVGLLMGTCILYVFVHGPATLLDNLRMPMEGNLLLALALGFSAAMLGVSGFESSANYVEEQEKGVFPKTLRNMWIAVTAINPAMALLALALLPLGEIAGHKEDLLAKMGQIGGGTWLAQLVSADAMLVLSGAVLTSYVGVNGLVRRMTLDRCLPQFLLKTNRRGSTHRILIGFFVLNLSILLITAGDIRALAGVYTLSFLAVMALFGIGNILLKVRRNTLPRPTRAGWVTVLIAIAAVIGGFAGNAYMNPPYLLVFLQYFIPTALLISIMLSRITLLKGCLYMVRQASVFFYRLLGGVADVIRKKIDEINAQQVVFFTRGDNVANLNNAMLYVQRNEHTNRMKIVTVVDDPKRVPAKLKQDMKFLDEAYPTIDVEFVILEGTFSPKLIADLARQWKIPTNFMFIGSPAGNLPYDLAELGGVRLII
jgi:amino acid transporter